MKFDTGTDKERENPTVGPHCATLIQVIDLGTQKVLWEGAEKLQHKVKLVWELDEKMADGKPFVAHRDFTTSLHEKASLRLFLEGWRGTKFSPDQLQNFTLKNLLEKSCILTLVSDKTGQYVNVASSSVLMKGMTAVVPVNPIIYFDLSDFNRADFEKLWPWVQKKIQDTPEYKDLMGKSDVKSTNTPSQDSTPFDDDIPF